MNILPKKRWHVRTKQNIERVRRDEANAAEEEKELKRRIRLAEQEARTDLLRKKARGITEDGEKPDSVGDNHANFFKELEENGYVGGKNIEHEKEEKARKEKFEKDLGILTYLGQNSLELKGETPWYLKSELKELISKNDEDDSISMKQKAKLDKMDPLNDMKKYLAMKGHKYLEYKSSKEKNTKTHKQAKTESPSSSSKTKMSKIEELRAKRLKRESEERMRSQKYLETLRKGPSAQDEVVLDDRLRTYNSQFNPHLARNNIVNEKDNRFQS